MSTAPKINWSRVGFVGASDGGLFHSRVVRIIQTKPMRAHTPAFPKFWEAAQSVALPSARATVAIDRARFPLTIRSV